MWVEGAGWRVQSETNALERARPQTPDDRTRLFFRRPAAAANSRVTGRDEKLTRVEAALFVAPEPLSPRKLTQVALLADVTEARAIIDRLNAEYDAAGCAFRAERVAGGYRLLTRPVFARWLQRIHHRQAHLQLSAPALETLTIIAYQQPVKRADVEAIRGVQSAEMIKQLMEQGLVRIGGEEDSLGRPYLYVTTRLFLESFGMRSLDELPGAADLRRREVEPPADADAAPEPDAESETAAA